MVAVLVTTRNPQDQFCGGVETDLDCCAEARHGHCDCWFEEFTACCQCGRVLGPIVYVVPDHALMYLVTSRFRRWWR